jgi:hypothetical protein
MKKLLFLFVLYTFIFAGNISNIHHNLNNGNWTTTPGNALTTKGVLKSITIQAVGTGTRQFLFNDGASSWWKYPNTTPISVNTILNASTANSQDINISVTDQKYYTFNVQNTSGNPAQFSVLETDYQPKTITSVTQTPSGTAFLANTNITVTATLSAALSTGEKAFVRYTTDNWTTSQFVEMTLSSGTTYQATIPGQADGTTVKYYVLTTNQATPAHATVDYFTLNLENNSGSNYTVGFYANLTTYHTITLASGTPEDIGFRVNEKLGTAGSTNYYITWDASYIYIATTGGASITSGDKLTVMIDVDPSGTNGSTNEFNGVNTNSMVQKPDYIVQLYQSGTPIAKLYKNVSDVWTYVKDIDNYADGSNYKLKLAIADLDGATGVSTYNSSNPIQFVFFMSNTSSRPYSVYPSDNPQGDGSTVITATKAVKFSSLGNNIVPSTAASTSALPVEISFVKGYVKNNKVVIEWSTATEINNKGFEIEKFENNIWKVLGFVAGKNNSNIESKYQFVDNITSTSAQYRIKQIDNDGNYKYIEVPKIEFAKITKFDLKQNYPNPFNPSTRIMFELPTRAKVQIKVYNIIGSEVATIANDEFDSGLHSVNFDANNLPAGNYIVKMTTSSFTKSIKVTLIK